MTPELIHRLVEAAIERGKVLRFNYKGASNGLSYRVLSPYEVNDGRVLGYDHEREGLRQFTITGIRSAVLADDPYVAPQEG